MTDISTNHSESFRKVPNFHDFAAGEKDRGPSVPYAESNNPSAGQWKSSRMSKSFIADYKQFVMTDGEGVRCSLYVSGCPFHCAECFNESIWNFNAGRPYDDALEERILEDLGNDFVQGITFLGGEPMLNTGVLIRLARRIREEFGNSKDIWCWTGYTWEELMRDGESADKRELLELIDILVDGRYVKELHSPLLQFRGSSNQRIIDVRESLKNVDEPPVIWSRLHDQSRYIPELRMKDRVSAEK